MIEKYSGTTPQSEEKLKRERFDAVFGSEEMQYLELRDIVRRLVPAMRREGIPEALLVVYEGNTENVIAELEVRDDGSRTDIRDDDGNKITLFGGKPAPGMRRRQPQGERVVHISEWLRDQGYRVQEVTFCPFVFEEEEEEDIDEPQETDTDLELEDDAPAEAERAEAVVVEPDVAEEQISDEIAGQQVKIPKRKQRKRPPKRKKKTRAAIKEERLTRELEGLDAELDKLSDEARILRERMTPKNVHHVTSLFADLGRYLSANPRQRQHCIFLLTHKPKYTDIALILSIMRGDRYWKSLQESFPKAYRRKTARGESTRFASQTVSDLQQIRKLALQMYPEGAHTDPDRSHEAFYFNYRTERTAEEYLGVLFPDTHPLIFSLVAQALEEERWLDIGSGETYKNPKSLMNVMPSINPKVTIVGCDPMYGGNTGPLDTAYGRNELDPEWTKGKELYPYTAQRLEFEDASFDAILSCWVFDKFEKRNEGQLQGLRQVARVLKPGGTARIYPVLSELVDSGVVEKYFNVISKIKWEGELEEFGYWVHLERKSLSVEEEEGLRQDINSWLGKNPR